MKEQITSFLKLTILSVGSAVLILFMLGIASFPAKAESKSLYKAPWNFSLPKDIASGSNWQRSVGETMKKHQIQVVNAEDGHPVKSGTQSIRFEIREGDCSYNGAWSDCKGDRYRSELSQSRDGFKHKFFAWSIYIPEDFQSVDPVLLAMGQIHQNMTNGYKADNSKPTSYAQSLTFHFNNGGYWVARYLRAYPPENDPYSGYFHKKAHLLDVKDMLGKWTDIVLEFRGSANKDGIVKVWVNGELKYDYKGQTSDGGRNYFKFGMYQSWVSRINNTPPMPWIDGTTKDKSAPYPTQVVYYDDIRVGNSFAKVTKPY
jgi:hypothetical protein